MDISLSHLIGGFFVSAFVYLILALQVRFGFPPFYRRGSWGFFARQNAEEQRATKYVVRRGFGLMAALGLFALTELPVFMLLAGIICAWIGLWLRRDLLEETGGPLPWVMFPLALPWVVRWPMLLFDVWTLGLAVGFGVLTRL